MPENAFEVCQDQSDLIAALSQPTIYNDRLGLDTEKKPIVTRHETHASVVFLIGDRAYKLKRAVKYPYLDYSTLECRHAMCKRELAVNKPNAPMLYLGIVSVTDDGNGYVLGGSGEVVDWLVEMVRFSSETRFDAMAEAGTLTESLVGDVADEIARVHQGATVQQSADARAMVEAVLGENQACQSDHAGPDNIFDADAVMSLDRQSRQTAKNLRQQLKARADHGFIRHCHGDLHLGNLCLVNQRPVLFDAIEFNDAFIQIDVAFDLAFLLMDLRHRGMAELASLAMNRWIDATTDITSYPLIPLYMSLRAGIRAHVEAQSATHVSESMRAERHVTEARQYLAEAELALKPVPPRLIGVGGLSGTGKSRLSRALAPYVGAVPGARVVRSDVIRKRLAGVGRLDRLPDEAYAADMTIRTFDAVFDEIEQVLRLGHSVIADAVFASAAHRTRLEDIAGRCGVPFLGLWLEAPLESRVDRVEKRVGNVSDAGADIATLQEAYDLGDMTWVKVSTAGSKSETVRRAKQVLGVL